MAQRGDIARAANRFEGHPVLQGGARAGYAIGGVLHILIGWIAFQVAWFSSARSADESGALQTLAKSSTGRFTLWVGVIGFFALALWTLASTLAARSGGGSSQWAEMAKGIARTVVYGALGWTSFKFATGEPTSSKQHSADFTATLLQQTGGRVLVCAIGLAIVGVGLYHVRKGWTKSFLQDLGKHPGPVVMRLGVVGYVANGVSLAVVGALFVTASVQNSASKATGMDGALRALRQQAFGPWLLTAVALGIAAYGCYSLARARYARV